MIAGLVIAARPEPIVNPAIEFHDHLSLSMYSASNRQSAVADYHPMVASVLLECKILYPDRFIFGLSDPLGLLLIGSALHPNALPKHSLCEALSALCESSTDAGMASVLDAGVQVAKSLFPGGTKAPKRSEAASVAADCRATIDSDCETAGRVFWDWLCHPM